MEVIILMRLLKYLEIVSGQKRLFIVKKRGGINKMTNNKYSKQVKISFMFDKWGLLNYKDSPIDDGPEKFLELFKKRIIL